ncbi:hypothetical protein PPYR_14614 [Photinus pyralis]|uniref:6-phosphogluconolactonase n=2 Tax=Photinus pyralis TaxID=7054 RepID=A0A5N4A5Q4_PHOPY|nr:6-phosphogluconolactonase [Photinus pyralis]KAB0792655.1 hypothetical protein PPYR_14614 [Photinus pyralis]
MSVIIKENEHELSQELAKLIETASNEAINDHNGFFVGVSGGSLITLLIAGLKGIRTDFSKWKIFFNDERVVPVDDPDSTFGAYKKDLVGKVPITEDQFVQIKQGVTADVAAKDYVQQMAQYFTGSWPAFDLLLLGMGPDGHTCSLFPGHPLLEDDSRWVAPITDSPKPPPARVTITFPVINNAKACIFAMWGDGKADMLRRVLVDKEDLPVNRVKPKSGKLFWIVDKAAGKYLKK